MSAITAPLRSCIALLWVTAALSAGDVAAAPPPPAAHPAPEELPAGAYDKPCQDWLQVAIRSGMPDVRGASFWQGTWSHEPDQDAHPRISLLGFTQLHLRLRDGRWLMRGIYLRGAAEPALMLKPGFTPIDPQAQGVLIGDGDDQQDPLLDITGFMPNTGLIALLQCAGLAQASNPRLARYDVPGWQRDWTTRDALLLTSATDDAGDEQILEAGGHPVTPDQEGRRLIQHLLILLAQHAGTTPEVVGLSHAAAALLSPDERAVRGAAIERLAVLPPESDDLPPHPSTVQQLQDWNAPFLRRSLHRGGADHETDHDQVPIPWTADLVDQLVDLVGDTRPSRWTDRSFPRSIGENALRALSWRWGLDPRLLIGRDPAVAWTPAEQATTAQALQAWWRPWRGKSVTAAIAGDPRLTTLLWTTRLVKALDPADQPAAARQVVAAWTRFDQAGRDTLPIVPVEEVLVDLGDAAPLDALVRSWPVSGPLRRTLAMWHEVDGDHAPMTAYLKDALDGRLHDPLANLALLQVIALNPDQERLDLLLDGMRADPTTSRWRPSITIATKARRGYSYGGETPLFERFGGFSGSMPMVSALVLAGLWDERPLPPTTGADVASATDLRVCDLIAFHRAYDELCKIVSVRADLPAHFDRTRPKAERDAILVRCRAGYLPVAANRLAAAGLHMASPAGGPLTAHFPAWWQAELEAAQASRSALALLITNTTTCAPCVRLEQEVLSQPAWKAWAAAHVRLVVLDGGQHREDLAYWQRMNEISAIYGGAGTPNFFLIANDGRCLSPGYGYVQGGPDWYIDAFERARAHQR